MRIVSPQQSNARIAPLAVLPVFFNLEGKRVVAIGGSEPATWKIELLAAAGAQVEVFAEEICDELHALISQLGRPLIASPLRGEVGAQCRVRGSDSRLEPMGLHPSPKLCQVAGAPGDATLSPEGRGEDAPQTASCSVDKPQSQGSITLHRRPWTQADLTGAALAVADIEGDADALAFIAAARAAGVPYNVIDRPEFCQFQFGTIVNRSPVVVGISTAGAAPILGQAVRRRIETLLPQTLSAWAKLAQQVRTSVMDRLEAGPQRRAFWEKLVDRAFGDTPPTPMNSDIDAISAVPPTGRVTLVGAGPGDADLLTIKAVRALQSADVILFDDLVSGEVLELARREARRMLVGKRAARDSCRQEDINATMLSLARQGKHVVRLKSGDPMIFGRAGEEIEMLERHGIAVSVVPGVTAALALASRLGISLTHRDHAQSVHFVTGHSRRGVLPEALNWTALADPATTSVYYMSRRTLPEIVGQLRAQGMSHDTPAIIAGNVGRADEQVWRGTLAEAVLAVEAFPLSAPTIFAVGNALGAHVARSAPAQPFPTTMETERPRSLA